MSLLNDYKLLENRRQFFARGRNVMGLAALSYLSGDAGRLIGANTDPLDLQPAHFPTKAKHIIYLCRRRFKTRFFAGAKLDKL